jgi:hypothetical protein
MLMLMLLSLLVCAAYTLNFVFEKSIVEFLLDRFNVKIRCGQLAYSDNKTAINSNTKEE